MVVIHGYGVSLELERNKQWYMMQTYVMIQLNTQNYNTCYSKTILNLVSTTHQVRFLQAETI